MDSSKRSVLIAVQLLQQGNNVTVQIAKSDCRQTDQHPKKGDDALGQDFSNDRQTDADLLTQVVEYVAVV